MRRPLALAATAVLATAAAASTAAGAPSVLAQLPSGADARDVAHDNGVELVRAFPQIGWAEYELPAAAPAAARTRLLDDGRVFRLDFQRRGEELEPQLVPNDTYTASPGIFGDGVETDYYWEQARFYTAWDLGRGSLATRVAVVDNEIDRLHPDLAAKVVASYNAEAQFPSTHRGPETRATAQQIADDDLHGTHVAGVAAAATNNAAGVSGAGFDAGLMAVKITLTVQAGQFDSVFIANAVDGITWATDNGADVINMSFGTSVAHPALAAAVNYAASRDVLPVAAAGNNQDDPDPADRGVPLYPAAFERVLAVGATDSGGVIAPFSTNGPYVDVAAPGSRILSTWDTRAGGSPGGGLDVNSGTSTASPLVAGLAVLVRDLRPDLPQTQVQDIIRATAADRGAPGRDNAYGAGVIDAEAALRAAGGAALAAEPVAPAPPPPAAAPAPPAAPVRRTARLVYRCHVGERRVQKGAVAVLRVERGRRLICRGRTVPGVGGARLEVQRLRRGRWSDIGSSRTTAAGRFGFAVALSRRGRWTVRAALPATPALAAATGPRTEVAVGGRRG